MVCPLTGSASSLLEAGVQVSGSLELDSDQVGPNNRSALEPMPVTLEGEIIKPEGVFNNRTHTLSFIEGLSCQRRLDMSILENLNPDY